MAEAIHYQTGSRNRVQAVLAEALASYVRARALVHAADEGAVDASVERAGSFAVQGSAAAKEKMGLDDHCPRKQHTHLERNLGHRDPRHCWPRDPTHMEPKGQGQLL